MRAWPVAFFLLLAGRALGVDAWYFQDQVLLVGGGTDGHLAGGQVDGRRLGQRVADVLHAADVAAALDRREKVLGLKKTWATGWVRQERGEGARMRAGRRARERGRAGGSAASGRASFTCGGA